MTTTSLPANVIPLPIQRPTFRLHGGADPSAFQFPLLATIADERDLCVHLAGIQEAEAESDGMALSLVIRRDRKQTILPSDILFHAKITNGGFRVFDRDLKPFGPLHATVVDALLAILDACPERIEGVDVGAGAAALRRRVETTMKRLSDGEIRYVANIFYKPLFDFKGGLVLGRLVGWASLLGVRFPDVGDIIVIDEAMSRRYGFIRKTPDSWVVVAFDHRSKERNWPPKISLDKRTYCDSSSSFGTSVGNLMRLFLNDGNTWLSGHECLERCVIRKAVRSAVRGKTSPDDAFGVIAGT